MYQAMTLLAYVCNLAFFKVFASVILTNYADWAVSRVVFLTHQFPDLPESVSCFNSSWLSSSKTVTWSEKKQKIPHIWLCPSIFCVVFKLFFPCNGTELAWVWRISWSSNLNKNPNKPNPNGTIHQKISKANFRTPIASN